MELDQVTAFSAGATLLLAVLAILYARQQLRAMRREACLDRTLKVVGLVVSRSHAQSILNAESLRARWDGLSDEDKFKAFKAVRTEGSDHDRLLRSDLTAVLNLYEKIAKAYHEEMIDRSFVRGFTEIYIRRAVNSYKWLIDGAERASRQAGAEPPKLPFWEMTTLVEEWDKEDRVKEEPRGGRQKRRKRYAH